MSSPHSLSQHNLSADEDRGRLGQILIDRLRAFDTPTICNAIELFEVRPRNVGSIDGSIQAAFSDLPPIVGPACTATFRSGSPQMGGEAYGSIEDLCRLIESSPLSPIVVSEDLDELPAGATFGEVMCGVYKSLGAVGLITSGAGRDLQQVRALDFPVFLRSRMASHAYCHAVRAGAPVVVGGLHVVCGDLIHADANGATKIPAEIVDELPDAAAEYMACESIVVEACRTGERNADHLMERRREMAAALSKLRARVSRRRDDVLPGTSH